MALMHRLPRRVDLVIAKKSVARTPFCFCNIGSFPKATVPDCAARSRAFSFLPALVAWVEENLAWLAPAGCALPDYWVTARLADDYSAALRVVDSAGLMAVRNDSSRVE